MLKKLLNLFICSKKKAYFYQMNYFNKNLNEKALRFGIEYAMDENTVIEIIKRKYETPITFSLTIWILDGASRSIYVSKDFEVCEWMP